MNNLTRDLNQLILEPKREALIDECKKIILGQQSQFTPYNTNPAYYQIWFYHPFDFKYIFLGDSNYVVDVSNKSDPSITNEIFERYSIEEQDSFRIQKTVEFAFFRDCWKAVEVGVRRPVRCFLIEYGVIRGIDVNNGSVIDGNDIPDILKQENIEYP